MEEKGFEDLEGFRQFLRLHTSWVYEVMYDVYMVAQISNAKSKLIDNGALYGPAELNESAERMDREIRRHKLHMESIANRIKRES